MTYCLALRLDEGLVFLADTRTNAGVDNVSTVPQAPRAAPRAGPRLRAGVGRQPGDDAGGARPDRDLRPPAGPRRRAWRRWTTCTRPRCTSAGSAGRSAAHRDALNAVGADGTATFILGGQIAGSAPDIFLVYPEGNYIRASDDQPFLQIGETKYGKFMLRSRRGPRRLATAAKIALSSMMSTARANLSVGPPYDLGIYRNGSLGSTSGGSTPDFRPAPQAAGCLGEAPHDGRRGPADDPGPGGARRDPCHGRSRC